MDINTYILTSLHGLQVLISLAGCINGYRFLSKLHVVDAPNGAPKKSQKQARSPSEPTTVLRKSPAKDGAETEDVASSASQARLTRNIALRGVAAAVLSLLQSAYKVAHPAPAWSHLAWSLLLVGLLMGSRGRLLKHYQSYRPTGAQPVAAAYPSTHQDAGSELERAENLAGLLSYLEIAWIAAGLLGAWTLRPVRT